MVAHHTTVASRGFVVKQIVSFNGRESLLRQPIPSLRSFLTSNQNVQFHMMAICGLIIKQKETSVECHFLREAEISEVLREAMHGVLADIAIAVGGVTDVSVVTNGVREQATQ